MDRNPHLFEFVSRLLRFRRLSPFFQDDRFWSQPGGADVTWHGVEVGHPDWGDTSHSLAFELTLASNPGAHLYVALNAFWEPLEFELPPLAAGLGWALAADSSAPAPDDVPVPHDAWPTTPGATWSGPDPPW